MLNEVDLIHRGGHVFDSSLLKEYQRMSAEEKIDALKKAIHMDEKPLCVLVAMLAILEPDKIECVFNRLSEFAHHGSPPEES